MAKNQKGSAELTLFYGEVPKILLTALCTMVNPFPKVYENLITACDKPS